MVVGVDLKHEKPSFLFQRLSEVVVLSLTLASDLSRSLRMLLNWRLAEFHELGSSVSSSRGSNGSSGGWATAVRTAMQ